MNDIWDCFAFQESEETLEKKKKTEMIYVCDIICMLHCQELTRKSIYKSTVKYNNASGLSAF